MWYGGCMVTSDENPLTREKLIEALRVWAESSSIPYNEAWRFYNGMVNVPPTPEQQLMDRINERFRSVR